MADQKNPETSTVRSALAAVGAVDDLLRPGREGAVLDADTAVAALVVLIEEVRALRPHQARDLLDHLEARLAAGALSPRTQPIRVPPGVPITVYNVGQHSGDWPSGVADPDYWPVPQADPDDPTPDVEPTTAEGTDDADDIPTVMQPDTMHPDDVPWGEDGKRERATAAVDELAARVNAEPPA